jgi:hypothetical protein
MRNGRAAHSGNAIANTMDLRRSNAANAVLGLSQLSIATGGISRLLAFGLATGAIEPNGQTVFP